MKRLIFLSLACVLVACSGADTDNNDDNGGSDAGGGDDVATTDDTGGGGGDDLGSGGDDTGSGGDDVGPGGDDVGPGGDDVGVGDMGLVDVGPSRLEAHDCTYDTATDMTGMATVVVTDIEPWTIPHAVCIIVDAGTVVTWTGNFSQHPLDGGVVSDEDPNNPIEVAGDGVTGNATIDVTLDTPGDYPYYCGLHLGSMVGVIYVD